MPPIFRFFLFCQGGQGKHEAENGGSHHHAGSHATESQGGRNLARGGRDRSPPEAKEQGRLRSGQPSGGEEQGGSRSKRG